MILVTGATGNVGRELLPLLVSRGEDVRVVTRDRARITQAGVEVIEADLKSESLAASRSLEGVDKVFLNPAAINDPSGFIAAAAEQGVQRIVLLSANVIDDDLEWTAQTGFIARRHKMLEGLIEESGLEWTHIRSNMLMSNAYFEILPFLKTGDTVSQAYGEAQSAPVDERDVAAAVATVLLDDSHVGRVYALTGPASITERDKVRLIGEAIGRPTQFVELTHEQAAERMRATFPMEHSNGKGDDHIETVLRYLQAAVGKPADLSPDVQTLLGREPHNYAEWAYARRAILSEVENPA